VVLRKCFAAVIGEEQDGNCNEQKQKVSVKDSIFHVSLSPGKMSGSKNCLGVAPPCDNHFKVLRCLLENYPSSACECSSLVALRLPQGFQNLL